MKNSGISTDRLYRRRKREPGEENNWCRVQNVRAECKIYKTDCAATRPPSGCFTRLQDDITEGNKVLRNFENVRDRHIARSTKMVWKSLKMKSDLQAKSEKGETQKTTKRACKCGERCKRCSEHCKCGTKRVLVRPPMFNYFTDMMH